MSSLINLSIRVDQLPKEKFVKGKTKTVNGKEVTPVYYNLTVSVNDDTNDWGQNVSAFDSQTKEEREAKKKKDYIGNGKVIWTDGSCVRAEQKEDGKVLATPTQADPVDDLPF
jgi:hypothetical protein